MSNYTNIFEGEEVEIVDTDSGKKDGQVKCPNCGATDVRLNTKTGMLRCDFCRTEFKPVKDTRLSGDISELKGMVMGSGAKNIDKDSSDLVTLKCLSCGAEVTVNTAEALHAKCHWCHETLSINNKTPNGAVPDVVLPFSITKQEAQVEIKKFLDARKTFCNPVFARSYDEDMVNGVYFPYMIVDANAHSVMNGKGERLIRKYSVKNGDSSETRYDAELYDVGREFDLEVEGLTIESSSDKFNKHKRNDTNNVINAIMPFDVENSLEWNANYLKGYSMEKRDMDVSQLENQVGKQLKDISRFAANDTLNYYNRGVRWENEKVDVLGSRWKAAYLPVWLYSYLDKRGVLHYIAVNGRTKETMGSVPMDLPKFWFSAIIVFILSLIVDFFIYRYIDFEGIYIYIAIAVLPFLFFVGSTLKKYRNADERHYHEKDTKHKLKSLRRRDNFIKTEKGLRKAKIENVNNERVDG